MDNRTAIINCTLELFAAHGYEAVGVQEIVKAAGITKPTLYHYFGSKQGLLEVILKEKFEQFNKSIEKVADYNGDLPLALYRLVSFYFNYVIQNPKFYRMSLSMIFSPPESDTYKAIMPFLQKLNGMLEELFKLASLDHGNMKGRHTAYAATLLGMIHTYIQLWFYGVIELNEEVAFKSVHQFMHGIYS
ncbi:MAG: TetR/AcrR family transcriptional regulator [Bacillota bacterium]|nr:TetR/AcrR family transcriptional regulator [Bacillota bacterium]